jgi:hypothetical protein
MWWRSGQVRSLLWPLFAFSAWSQINTVLAGTASEGAFWPLIGRSAWAQASSVVADTKDEGTALASVASVVVGSASHCVGGHDI